MDVRPRSEAIERDELQDLIDTMKRVDCLLADHHREDGRDSMISTSSELSLSDVVYLDDSSNNGKPAVPHRVTKSNRPIPRPRSRPISSSEEDSLIIDCETTTTSTGGAVKPVPRPRSRTSKRDHHYPTRQPQDNVQDIEQRLMTRLGEEGLLDGGEYQSGMYDCVDFADPKILVEQSTMMMEEISTLVNHNEYQDDGLAPPPPPPRTKRQEYNNESILGCDPKTDDGFDECPPPPDFVLRVNDVVWRNVDANNPTPAKEGTTTTTTTCSASHIAGVPNLEIGSRAPSVYEAIPAPGTTEMFHPPRIPRGRKLTDSMASRDSGQCSGEDHTADFFEEDQSSDGSDEFDGFGDLITSYEEPSGFKQPEPQVNKPSTTTSNTNRKECAIPSTDEALRRTVEDLVDSKLKRKNRDTTDSGSDTDSLGSARSAMSAQDVAQIVAETVGRVMRDTYNVRSSTPPPQGQAQPQPRSPRHQQRNREADFGSDTESIDSARSGMSAREVAQIVADTVDKLMRDTYKVRTTTPPPSGQARLRPHSPLQEHSPGRDRARTPPRSPTHKFSPVASPLRPTASNNSSNNNQWDAAPVDREYVAGDATMGQLLPVAANGKVIAKNRIKRLRTGNGDPLCGERIFIRRNPKLGFGFSISGDSPTYVHSVDPGGAADGGVNGLLVGDVILKINDEPCARVPRETVIQRIRAVKSGDVLSVVVARTPAMKRKNNRDGTHTPPSPVSESATQPVRRNSASRRREEGGPLGRSISDGAAETHMRGRKSASIADHLVFQNDIKPKSPSRVSRDATDAISLCGWLYVLERRKWELRWVELKGSTLSIYPDAEKSKQLETMNTYKLVCSAVSKRDRGSVSLDEVGAFKLVWQSVEPVYLKAETEAEMYIWIKTFTSSSLKM